MVQHRPPHLLTFADDDTSDGDGGQQEPHLPNGGFVAALLVTLAGPPAGGQARAR
ncbi:MAG TPA: hypothetical protein VK390_09170 [Propionibacteriaceae bacterium]|nr:hypothetical protein [Propionibacteriaceae bacterium]